MSHLVETMAYAQHQAPWHKLGRALLPQQSLAVWLSATGMDWWIKESTVQYLAVNDDGVSSKPYPDGKVLYRSDTLEPLSVVGNHYHIVQPREVLEFYRDLVATAGFELETAGVLKGGRKLWALSRTGQKTLLKGGDRVKAYLLLATSCDRTPATTAQFTSIRAVCNKTLQMVIGERSGAVKVPHSTKFDPVLVKEALGIGLSSWDAFMRNITATSRRSVSAEEAQHYFSEVLGESPAEDTALPASRVKQQLIALYEGAGMGAGLAAAQGTAWGLLNAVTEFVDHHRRARSSDYWRGLRLVWARGGDEGQSPLRGAAVGSGLKPRAISPRRTRTASRPRCPRFRPACRCSPARYCVARARRHPDSYGPDHFPAPVSLETSLFLGVTPPIDDQTPFSGPPRSRLIQKEKIVGSGPLCDDAL